MGLRPRSIVLFVCAACGGNAVAPSVTTTSPAEIVAVPLTAASAQIAAQDTIHEDLAPPWSLTASDGSGLVMTRVEAKAVFEGPLAFTELHLYFHNPEHRRREGTFQITLPPDAAVSRFAMENDGQWMEAEVVEKQLARRAYDDFLHRKQDPALLEKAAGNQFTAKVFPIPADGDKHLVISYSQELPGERYVLPLRGLPKVAQLDVRLLAEAPDGQHTTQLLSKRDWQPDRDFVSNATVGAAAVGSGTLVAAQVTAPPATGAGASPAGVTLLVDTSASRALGYARYIQRIDGLVGELRTRYGAKLPLQVVAFDQDWQLVYAGKAGGWSAAQSRALVDRGAAGASDLGQALAAFIGCTGACAGNDPLSPQPRMVVVTDGVMTAGAERADLVTSVGRLAARGVDRLDVVLMGGLRDGKLADALVHAGLPHAGTVLDGDHEQALAEALGQPVQVDVPVEVAGATWVYPRTIPSLRAGTSTMVYARLAEPAQTIDLALAGVHRRIGVASGAAPLVERAVAAAEIDELEQRLTAAKAGDAAALRTEIAKRSIAARVISSQTSLLVLESDADYARYGIDRRALADVLVIGTTGLERLHREPPAQIAQPQPMPHMDDGDFHVPPTKVARLGETAKKEKNDDETAVAIDGVSAGSAAMGQGEADQAGADDNKDVAEGAAGTPMAGDQAPPAGPPPPPAAEPRAAAGERMEEEHIESRSETQRPVPVTEPAPAPESGRGAGVAAPNEPLEVRPDDSADRAPWPPKDKPAALTGQLAEIEAALAAHDLDGALAKARDWHAQEPGDVRALIGLGDALEAKGSLTTAARVYGSIIDLFPGRADMRRFAGERLARLTARLPAAVALEVDTYRRAVADRPDHLTGHRLLAYALLRAGQPADAFAAILAGFDQPYPAGRYAGGERVLADDAGMIGAAYAAAQPARMKEIVAELSRRGLSLATRPSTRFILYWETDGNDVDFHIQDARGNHAWYGHKPLASGGELYADITTGYGPECFAIPGTPHAGPYRLSIDYYSQGPMGYGMGLLEIQRFDGKGHLHFEDRPYVIMNDHAYVDLGSYP